MLMTQELITQLNLAVTVQISDEEMNGFADECVCVLLVVN